MIIHPRLQQDTYLLGRFELSLVLLMNDRQYPWLILLPQRQQITEIHQLSDADQQCLMRESSLLASRLSKTFQADKMNIAALGNKVPQLHVHHIVRYRNDAAWPEPVWGAKPCQPYGEQEAKLMIAKLQERLPIVSCQGAFAP